MSVSQASPSEKTGFARGPGESAQPHLWEGLRGLWVPLLGPTGETLFDVSGIGRRQTIQRASGDHWAVAEPGYVLRFDGTAGDYHVTPPPFSNVAACSAVCWLNATSATSYWGKWNALFEPSNLKQWFMRNAGQVFIRKASDTPADANASAPNWNYGEWQLVVAVADGTNLTVWNKGVAGTPAAAPGPYIPSQTNELWGIGRGQTNAMIGDIALVAYYDWALGGSEIQQFSEDPSGLLRLRRRVFSTAVAAPAVAIMNQFQGSHLGADLYNGTLT